MPAKPTARQLAAAEAAHKAALGRSNTARTKRDDLVRAALAAGWTVRQVAEATNISIGRISQIAHHSR